MSWMDIISGVISMASGKKNQNDAKKPVSTNLSKDNTGWESNLYKPSEWSNGGN